MYLIRGGFKGAGDAAPADPDDGRPATGPSAGLLLTEPLRGLADLTARLHEISSALEVFDSA